MQVIRTNKTKWIIIFSILLMLVILPENKVMAAVTDDTTVDFILVIDCSATMENSDPEGLSISAAKMFIDMIPMEKARVGVVGFGPNWGEESYIYEQNKKANTFTKIAYPLSNVVSSKDKQEVKDSITNATIRRNEKNTYTTIGYALQAALDMLYQGNTEEKEACIILMSDGRLTELGKEVDLYTEGNVRHSKSLDQAILGVKEKEWPIYCLELAFDLENNKHWTIPTGLHQMESIAKESGGEKFTAHSNSEVEKAFSDIFTRFFNVQPITGGDSIKNGSSSMEFEIEEMIAETNITITSSEMNKVKSVELTDPNGVVKKYKKSDESESRIVTFEDNQYIVIKLLQPAAGNWKIKAYGDDGVNIKLMAIPIREMNFQLNTSWNPEEMVAKGKGIEFYANFVYNGRSYSSEKFYKENPAYLEIVETGEKFEMVGDIDNYSGKVEFKNSGTFTVRACVESGYFRNDKKESGDYIFIVGNNPPLATEKIENIEAGFNETITIDCSKYFNDPDDDKLNYKIDVDKVSGIKTEVDENDILTIITGEKAGEFTVNIKANDGSAEKDVEQTFKISIVNQPLVEKGSSEIKRTVSYNAEKLPKIIIKIFNLNELAGEPIDCSNYFEDPDEILPIYEIKDLEKDAAISVEETEPGIFNILGLKQGEETFYLVAKDASDETVSFQKTIVVKSVNANSYLWNNVKWKVIIVLVIIIILLVILLMTFSSRGIHGVWDIAVNGREETEIRLAKTGAGKKKKCTLNAILLSLDLSTCSNNKITIKAGNNWTRIVIIGGLESVDEIEYGERTYNQSEKKLKKAVLKRNQSIELNVDGTRITLHRIC